MHPRAGGVLTDGVLDVLIEIPAWSFRKVSVTPDAGWKPEFWSLVPCPFNYGSAPDVPAPDGEGQDVIVIGPRLRRGDRVRVSPRLRVEFIDGGVPDDKLVARLDGAPLGVLDHLRVRLFFLVYTWFKRARQALRGQPIGGTVVTGYRAI